MKEEITVFTPTYNREKLIETLYRSLQRQTDKNFEWLVVDDGSSDGTEQLIRKWMAEEKAFCIRYYKTENGGKHRAINLGLDLACGEFFMVVDSDDYLSDDAVEKLHRWLAELDENSVLKGVAANKGRSLTETPNPIFSEQYLDKTLLDMYSYEENGKKVLSGERALCFRTDFHRNYKYPEFEGETFLTEAVTYNRMARDGYQMRFYNDIIWVYEYQEDGLTHQGSELYRNNPRGYGLWMREKAEFEGCSLLQRCKVYYGFTCDLLGRCDIQTISECLDTSVWVIQFLYAVHKGITVLKKAGKGIKRKKE